MDAKILLDLYCKVRKQHALPEMEAMTVTLLPPKSVRLKSAQTAWDKLNNFKPTQGWIGFQSVNASFTDGKVTPMDGKSGALLAAEAVNAKGQSLHIRYDGAGDWIVTQYEIADGGEHLADRVTHIAHNNELGKLRYRRVWRIDAEHGAAPFAACFIGFGEE